MLTFPTCNKWEQLGPLIPLKAALTQHSHTQNFRDREQEIKTKRGEREGRRFSRLPSPSCPSFAAASKPRPYRKDTSKSRRRVREERERENEEEEKEYKPTIVVVQPSKLRVYFWFLTRRVVAAAHSCSSCCSALWIEKLPLNFSPYSCPS